MGCCDFLCKPKHKKHELGTTEISEENFHMNLFIWIYILAIGIHLSKELCIYLNNFSVRPSDSKRIPKTVKISSMPAVVRSVIAEGLLFIATTILIHGGVHHYCVL